MWLLPVVVVVTEGCDHFVTVSRQNVVSTLGVQIVVVEANSHSIMFVIISSGFIAREVVVWVNVILICMKHTDLPACLNHNFTLQYFLFSSRLQECGGGPVGLLVLCSRLLVALSARMKGTRPRCHSFQARHILRGELN